MRLVSITVITLDTRPLLHARPTSISSHPQIIIPKLLARSSNRNEPTTPLPDVTSDLQDKVEIVFTAGRASLSRESTNVPQPAQCRAVQNVLKVAQKAATLTCAKEDVDNKQEKHISSLIVRQFPKYFRRYEK